MKRIFLSIILIIILLTGCSNKGISSENTQNESGKLKVYTSFYAVYDFTKKIGGDRIELYNLVPTGTEPHDWEPASKDMMNLEKADILFYNGAGMESWIEKIKNSISSTTIQYCELSQNIDLIDGDPHVWLDPKNVKIEAELIKNKLCETDSKNSSYYQNNYENLCAEIDELDSEYKTSLSSLKQNNIVVAHEAYGYLCRAYSLNQIPIEGISADSEPSLSKMKEIAEFVRENNIKYIFFEELINPKIAQTIADEVGAELLVLNPFEGLTQEQIDNGYDYFKVMYENLDNLKKALR